MASSKAPFRFAVQERSFPVPSGSPSQSVDWLPDYYGYSWVAFASRSSLVISITKSPTKEDELDLDICQVIDGPHEAPASLITCVRWAPLLATLAASCDHFLWIYTPQLSHLRDQTIPSDFPQGWILSHKLEHTFKVLSFAWTETGDGVLSVGTQVIMWRQNETGWCPLWTSHVTHPQSFAAATLFAKGLAATAQGNIPPSSMDETNAQVDDFNRSVTKGKATVWWWEESLGLLESELVHPQEVLFLQWRPSKGPFTLQEAFRPVLLTSCKDGAVRLWLEIDSGRARLDKALGKDVSVKHLKPAYFVSAVIEAEQCLHGILGVDVFVSWPFECRPRQSAGVIAGSSYGTNAISKRENVGSCEWLIGLGPEGSVCLWAVFCLDDIYPPRCPRVFLWKQADGVLSSPPLSTGNKMRHILVKVVSQRLGSGSADPPSTLDCFYTSDITVFHWSRVWPPVTAVCGDLSVEPMISETIGPGNVPGKARKDAWGMVTECFISNGHLCDIISIAMHPVTYTGLVATLDSQGCIFLWCMSLLMNRKLSLCVSVWKPSGQLAAVSLEFETLTWLPAVFAEDQTVLLLAHAGFVDCYLVSEGSKTNYSSLPLEVKLLSRFNLCIYNPQQRLDSIWALPLNSQGKDFLIVGLGKASGEVVSCNLEIVVEEASCHVRDQASDQVNNLTNVAVSTSSSSRLEMFELVSCIAIAPTSFLPVMQTPASSLAFEPQAVSRPYDIITGSRDGMLRLWKKEAGCFCGDSDVDNIYGVWLCVGLLKICLGPVMMIAVGCSGFKIATWGPAPLEIYGEGILIWDIEGLTDGAMFNLSGRVLSAGCPISVQWLDLSNGGSLLGVMTQSEVQVYAESRAYSKTLNPFTKRQKSGQQSSQLSWVLLASVPLFSNASCFTWGSKGSLLVPLKEHLLVYGPWIFADNVSEKTNQVDLKCLLESQWDQTWSLLKAYQALSSPLPMHHPVSMLYHLYTGNHQRARLCLSYLQQNLSGRTFDMEDKALCGLLQIYTPTQLLEILQMESKAIKKINNKQVMSLSWSAGLDRAFEDDMTSFSRMSLAGEGGDRGAAHQANEISTVLNIEKLELCLKKFSHTLGLAEDQRILLLTIADVLVNLDTEPKALEYASLDPFGQRFWLGVQLSLSDQCRESVKNAGNEVLDVESKVMAWALQSDCKDTLLDLCMCGELSWPAMRALGVGFWLTDTSQLRTRMEKLARAQYLMEKNPKHCTLLYLALQRKNVLMGLFKLSKDEKDKVLYEFLSRDFLVEKNQAAALKNAYVLLGKHQHDLAAAFFLLGGDLSSAASACAKNLGDLQLAFIICRLVEGINGPTEQRLIREYALPKAQKEGDYWLASLFQWLLGEHFKAIEELTGRLTISETMTGPEHQEKLSGVRAVSSDGIRGGFVDPQLGLFCLHLASKPVVQSGLSAASAAALCKWLTLKTTATLERLGLPLEALEYLSSSKDSFWSKLQPENKNVLVAAVTACKTRLAVEYQAQFVQAHPCWWFEQHTKLRYLKSSLMGGNHTQGHFSGMAADASNKLLQSFKILGNHFGIDTEHVAAKLASLAYEQNMLYLQCVFTRGTTDGSQSSNDTLFVPSKIFLGQSIRNLGNKWFKAIDPLGVCSLQSVSTTESCASREAGECSPLDATETFLLAIDLWLLLCQCRENMEVYLEVAVLILVLYSVAAWKKSHWNAIGFVLKLIKAPVAAGCIALSDIEAAFKIFLEKNDIASSMAFCKVMPHVCSDLGQLTEFEVWHVLGLAFWESFSGWAKQHLRNKPGRSDQITSTGLAQCSLQWGATHKDLLKALESVSSFFQRKLVFYLNTTVTTTSLSIWLLGNHHIKEIPLTKSSSVPSVSHATDISHFIPHTPMPPMNSPTDEVCKELLAPNRIRSTLEMVGAKLTTSNGRKGAPENLKSPSKDLSKAGNRDEITESAPHDREGAITEKLTGSVMLNDNREISARSVALERMTLNIQYRNGEEIFHSNGDLLEAVCVNSCCPEQVVVSCGRKGLLYFDLTTHKSFSITKSNLWSQAEWPQNGWASSESTPVPTLVSPGVGLKSREGPSLGLGGATVGLGMMTNVAKESSFKGPGVGIPGYGGMGAWGLGWEEWEDFDGVIDPLATMENVNTQAMDSHPLRPLFLVGSRNTHVYLWEFGKSSATATYGILPAANIPPPYALASISSVKFDHSGHRFATSAIDGTVCTWQLEVGGRSNVRPTDSSLCFDRHASDVAFVGGSGGIIAATGASQNDLNLVFWDTLAPSTTSQASVFCHEGGARCLEMFDHNVGGGSISSLIVTCGKAGDIAVHDFRYIATGKTKRAKYVKKEHGTLQDDQPSRKQQDGELNVNGTVWYIAKAHSGSISCVSAVPGTSLFFTGSKDGDVKLWDVNKCELVNHWHKVHDKHMFLQHNARGFGAVLQEFRGFGGVFQAAVTDIQPVALGFLTCGGDGYLRLFRRQDL